MLQAFIDDSIQAHEVLIIAGFVASSSQWQIFSGEWRECCVAAGWKNGVFKMRDAVAMAKRDPQIQAHIKRHSEIIKRYAQLGVSLALPLQLFKRIAQQFPMIGGNLAKPYYVALRSLMSQVGRYQAAHQLGPVDFIFDKMAVEPHIIAAWDVYERMASPHQRTMMGHKPIFEDDAKAVPLQAADMWAWCCRKSWRDGSYATNAVPMSCGASPDFPVLMMQCDEDDLVRQFQAASDRFSDI